MSEVFARRRRQGYDNTSMFSLKTAELMILLIKKIMRILLWLNCHKEMHILLKQLIQKTRQKFMGHKLVEFSELAAHKSDTYVLLLLVNNDVRAPQNYEFLMMI